RGWAGAPTASDLLEITTADGERFLHRISANASPFAPQTLTFPAPLSAPHDVGTPVVIRHPLLELRALDYGAWRSRLRVSAAADASAIVSLEFRLDVLLLRQPDAALPSRNVQVLDSESFRNLSLDPRHSRYLHRVIGTTWTASPAFVDDDGRPLRKVDNRSEG